jgi:hypothetical protein
MSVKLPTLPAPVHIGDLSGQNATCDIVNADIDAAAAIAESKLALNYATATAVRIGGDIGGTISAPTIPALSKNYKGPLTLNPVAPAEGDYWFWKSCKEFSPGINGGTDANTLGLWHLHNNSLLDSSGNGYTLGTGGTAPTYDSTYRRGEKFIGTGWLTTTALVIPSSVDLTLECWSEGLGLPPTGSLASWFTTAQGILRILLDANNYLTLYIMNDAGTYRFLVYCNAAGGGGTLINVATTAAVIQAQAHFAVVCRSSGGKFELYVNGAKVVDGAIGSRLANGTYTMWVGSDGSNLVSGVLDEVRVSKSVRYTSAGFTPVRYQGAELRAYVNGEIVRAATMLTP